MRCSSTIVKSGLLSLAFMSASCNQGMGNPTDGGRPDVVLADGEIPGVMGSTADIFQRLRPSCVGCHGQGASRPFFASLEAFENQIVYNTAFVQPGNPDGSELVRLLVGTGTNYPRMPIGRLSFLDLEQQGQTAITVEEIRAWIRTLQPRTTPPPPMELSSSVARRKTAEQIIETLMQQIGLTDADFFSVPAYDGAQSNSTFAVRSPNAIPYNPQGWQMRPVFQRFLTLGGPDWFVSTPRNGDISPSFLQTFVPLSQAWCRLAVNKANNTVFFRNASLTDRSSDPAGRMRIQQNIRYLHLRMLAEPATDADVTDLLGVFSEYETQSTAVAWTAVCSSLVRDPLWLTY